jgi:hypothetical protein
MKQIEIQGKIRFLVLNTSEDVNKISFHFFGKRTEVHYFKNDDFYGIKVFYDAKKRNFKNGFFLNNCTEEQAAELVDRDLDAYYHEYVNYGDGFNHDNAIDSLKSLLTANGVVLENPYPKPDINAEKYHRAWVHSGTLDREYYQGDLNRWQEAEKSVWKNPLFLIYGK